MKIGTEPIYVVTADGQELDINKYLPLVKNIVYKVSSSLIKSSELYLDLQAAGYVGLIEAAKNYDSTKASFTTFAYSHIKGRILRALTNEAEEDHTTTAFRLDIKRGVSDIPYLLPESLVDTEVETKTLNTLDVSALNGILDTLYGEDSMEKKIFNLRYKEEKVFTTIGKELGIHHKTAECKNKKIINRLRTYILNRDGITL